MKHPEYMIRVKLPNPGAYSGGPSGDTAYEAAYDAAVHNVLPPGFEVVKPRLNEKWPMDAQGYTWMLIRSVGGGNAALAHYIDEVKRLEAKLEAARKALA